MKGTRSFHHLGFFNVNINRNKRASRIFASTENAAVAAGIRSLRVILAARPPWRVKLPLQYYISNSLALRWGIGLLAFCPRLSTARNLCSAIRQLLYATRKLVWRPSVLGGRRGLIVAEYHMRCSISSSPRPFFEVITSR